MNYPAILQQFSQLEDPYQIDKHDLLALGITDEMTADLIETILDGKYYLDNYEDGSHLFAYIALGQLKTPQAIDGIIAGVKKWSHTDWFEWFCEGVPDIFERIGVVAIDPLLELLHDSQQTIDARIGAIIYLHHITIAHPEQRDRCVAALIEELERYQDNDPEFNGYLISDLAQEYKAIEAAPLMEAAFAAERVDDMFLGNWYDVQVLLGLKEPDPTRQRKTILTIKPTQLDAVVETQINRTKTDRVKHKAKRKQQKKSRQQNRRK